MDNTNYDNIANTDDIKKLTLGHCKGCGKKVIWLTTMDGKRIPLDPVPPVYVVKINHIGQPFIARERAAMVSHFATCPKANDFSAANRRKDGR
jgi:hypothetical protein